MFSCNRNLDIDVVRSVVRRHRVVWRLWQGGVEHSTTWRSILFGYCHICPFKVRIYEWFGPFLTLAIHFQHSVLSVRIRFQGSFWDWFVMWHPTHLTRHAPLLLVLVHRMNLIIPQIQGICAEWLSCSDNVCQFRPTSLYVFMTWRVRQARASRQMNYLPSILHLCFESIEMFRRPCSPKTYQWSGTWRPEAQLELLLASCPKWHIIPLKQTFRAEDFLQCQLLLATYCIMFHLRSIIYT